MIRNTTLALLALAGVAVPARAQLDPLLFIKDTQPFVLFVVDTSLRMQRDAPGDPNCVPGAVNAALCDVNAVNASSSYYDPVLYPGATAGSSTLGVTTGGSGNTTTYYRRKYVNLTFNNSGSADKATVREIDVVTDKDTQITPTGLLGAPVSVEVAGAYRTFEAPTRLSIARAAIAQAVLMNQNDVQFGILSMRQSSPANAVLGNYSPVASMMATQSIVGTTDVGVSTKWKMSWATVSATNGSNSSSPKANNAADVRADDDNASFNMLTMMSKDMRQSPNVPNPAYIAAGQDGRSSSGVAVVDAPLKFMLDDAFIEARRLIGTDSDCTNTIVVLIVGGGEGTTVSGVTAASAAATANTFLNVKSSRRVPIYVIAIAPPQTDVANLKLIAANSGGKYVEITKAMIDTALSRDMFPLANHVTDAAHPNQNKLLTPDDDGDPVYVLLPLASSASPGGGTVVVPEMVAAINAAVQHGMADAVDVNTAPTVALPYGPISEFQVTSPVIGTVNLDGARDINGAALTNTIVNDKAGNKIPQRSNLLLTTALVAPGFTAGLRAFRQYLPVVDATQPSGYKFRSDGTWERRLWVAKAPTNGDGSVNAAARNLYTAKTDGTIIAFNTSDSSNLATIAAMMGLSGANASADAAVIINYIRGLPLGPTVSSTPVIMNPPSLDPPPDDDYPAFANANSNRRSMIWIGTNYGVLEGIDARLGVEVWGFIPPTLLPKLKALRLGQPVTGFLYFVDGSAKVADVKIAGVWHTHMIMGEGDGGAFYQSFDVTMAGMSDAVQPNDDALTDVLGYFSNPSRISLNWAFPKYADFDPTLTSWDSATNSHLPWGDLKSSAPTVEKTVGHTWSNPAVGQIKSTSGPFAVLFGSGFMPYSTQQQANRGGVIAGTTFYLLSAKDGAVYDSKDVGSDFQNENVDDCSENEAPSHGFGWFHHHLGKKKKWFGCNKLKNALQSHPVATGPADSRFITSTYMGDLDGRVWRFDFDLDGSNSPKINANVKLWETGQDQPIFAAMATVNVGGSNQYIFYSTGSDLLPSTDVSTRYHLLGLLDTGNSGTRTLDQLLDKGNDRSKDEKATSFPAVAGDIVFFTTTSFNPANGCKASDAKLWAFTFIGGPAYDSSGDNKVDSRDTPVIKTIAGARATAPFIADQHLVFGTASNVEIFGDSADYNNSIAQSGVRILSWREVR